MPKPNYIIYDIETSGLKPQEGHEIVQLSAIAINHWDLERHHANCVDLLLKPLHPEKASKEAIEIIGEEKWNRALSEGLDPKEALKYFVSWCEKANDKKGFWTRPIRVGHNIKRFDNPFTDFWLEEYKVLKRNKYDDLDAPWGFLSIDTMDLFHLLFESDPNVLKYNLDACAALLGLARTTDKHDSMEDVEITTEIFVRAMRFIRTARREVKVNK